MMCILLLAGTLVPCPVYIMLNFLKHIKLIYHNNKTNKISACRKSFSFNEDSNTKIGQNYMYNNDILIFDFQR